MIREDSKAPSAFSSDASSVPKLSDFESLDVSLAGAYFSISLLADVVRDVSLFFPDDGREETSVV